ncbi:flavodoxin [Clostridium sp. 19966]|uniref:flavodoxin n=1 Tax=Clostridium sp. 19966 TaxID=2768166 RepID=UPI0028DDD250|nr:flavodoxin [Clostridium sp. 19966]MDT8716691.1 flavodoxin [Clostridium sp. 19966]
MKKVSIIYWSNGGNVEVLADAIFEGAKEAGADVSIKLVSEAEVEDVTKADAVAFGSPSMDNDRIEQQELEPFINKFKLLPNNGKSLVLFGSYGWDNGKFIEDWKTKMVDYGFNVVGELAVKESPDEAQLAKAKELGKLLSK